MNLLRDGESLAAETVQKLSQCPPKVKTGHLLPCFLGSWMQAVADQTGVYNRLGMYVQPVVQVFWDAPTKHVQNFFYSVCFSLFLTGLGGEKKDLI